MESVTQEALSLWELWFNQFGLCWAKNSDDIEFCVFCKGVKPNHALQCPYPYAKQLVEGLAYKDSSFYTIALSLCPLGHSSSHFCTTCRDITLTLEKVSKNE